MDLLISLLIFTISGIFFCKFYLEETKSETASKMFSSRELTSRRGKVVEGDGVGGGGGAGRNGKNRS